MSMEILYILTASMTVNGSM